MQLAAFQFEFQLAGGDGGQRVAVAAPHALVEHQHVAGAVVAFRDLALEAGVRQRVVLHFHREPLLACAQRWSLGHRPALQRAIDFEPEVVVARARVVQLDHEDGPMPATPAGPRDILWQAAQLLPRMAGTTVTGGDVIQALVTTAAQHFPSPDAAMAVSL